jgi:hypothetical protein
MNRINPRGKPLSGSAMSSGCSPGNRYARELQARRNSVRVRRSIGLVTAW